MSVTTHRESEAVSVPSPCTSVCRMNERLSNEPGGLCEGCLRTLDEIVQWANAKDDYKRLVLSRIEVRRHILDERT